VRIQLYRQDYFGYLDLLSSFGTFISEGPTLIPNQYFPQVAKEGAVVAFRRGIICNSRVEALPASHVNVYLLAAPFCPDPNAKYDSLTFAFFERALIARFQQCIDHDLAPPWLEIEQSVTSDPDNNYFEIENL
jgi:hypothetical protein